MVSLHSPSTANPLKSPINAYMRIGVFASKNAIPFVDFIFLVHTYEPELLLINFGTGRWPH